MNNIIAADIGNSRIKLLNDDNLISIDYSDNWINRIKRFIPDNSNVYYSSVNPSIEDLLLSSSEITENINFVNAKIILEKEELIKYRHIKGIGTDRVLGMLGALSIAAHPAITVDCGTAVTINAIGKDSTVIGGAIFSGVFTQLNSLLKTADEIRSSYNNTTEKEFIENFNDSEPAAQNTTDALKSGIINSVVGGIESIVQQINSRHFIGEKPNIFTTGGYGKVISELLNKKGMDTRHVQTLVLEGILKLVN